MFDYTLWVLISLVVVILAPYFLIKLIPVKLPASNHHRYGSIDGLRGILSVLVFFHHFYLFHFWQVGGAWKVPDNVVIENIGSVSVKIFFMITAYIFTNKVLMNGTYSSWFSLYKSRVFRIVPMYVVFILFTFIYSFIIARPSFEQFVSFESIRTIIKWFAFVGGPISWYEDAGKVGAGVTWTLRYEWAYYFSLPILAFLTYKRINFVIPLFLFIAFVCIVNSPLFVIDNFIPFFFGWLAAKVNKSDNLVLRKLVIKNGVINIAFLVSLFFISNQIFYGIPVLIPAFMVFLNVTQVNTFFSTLKNKSIIFLGEISYSVYLLHGIVIFTIGKVLGVRLEFYWMPIVAFSVILISSLTYQYIERPFISLGHTKNKSNLKAELG